MEAITFIPIQEVNVLEPRNMRVSETGNFDFFDYFLGLQTINWDTFNVDKLPNLKLEDDSLNELVELFTPNIMPIQQYEVKLENAEKPTNEISIAKEIVADEFVLSKPYSVENMLTTKEVLLENNSEEALPKVQAQEAQEAQFEKKFPIEDTRKIQDTVVEVSKQPKEVHDLESETVVKIEPKLENIEIDKKKLVFSSKKVDNAKTTDEIHINNKSISTVLDSQVVGLKTPEGVDKAHSSHDSKVKIELPSNVSEVATKITYLANKNGGQMTLSLNPPELGNVVIDVRTHGKEVDVILKPESDQTKVILSEHIDELRHAISSQNLTLNRVEINVVHEPIANLSSLSSVQNDNALFMLNPDGHAGYGQERFYGRNNHFHHLNSKMDLSDNGANFSHNGRINISV